MIRYLLIIFCFIQTNAFKLLDIRPIFPKILKPCDNINPVILKQFIDLQNDDFKISEYNSTGIICSNPNIHYGYMLPYDNITDIWIKDELQYYPTTLHNVAIHELYHSYGLDHSTNQGIMNYSISINNNWWWSRPIEDCMKIYPSIDDLQGIMQLKYNSYSI